jgi:hypothetical protein
MTNAQAQAQRVTAVDSIDKLQLVDEDDRAAGRLSAERSREISDRRNGETRRAVGKSSAISPFPRFLKKRFPRREP